MNKKGIINMQLKYKHGFPFANYFHDKYQIQRRISSFRFSEQFNVWTPSRIDFSRIFRKVSLWKSSEG